ncbi:hypothetical protein VB776_04480 [Arcicella sp. DC2W]|uniref:Uncharacterized protein n=1 Tax=Arcicella gelida TaxID=2984195 RepID=A0ABU5S108_9BACT|nr:hypothetical protein [Arcicella sp. DC2W]MEA5402154.1 hypothetical protein [Arcicella sp. DC2W]
MGIPIAAILSAVGSITETVGSIFVSGDKVKIAQTEVDKAREAVNSIKAQGDIAKTKLAEKALDVKIAQYKALSSEKEDASNLSTTKVVGAIVIVLTLILVTFFAFKFKTKSNANYTTISPYPQPVVKYTPV